MNTNLMLGNKLFRELEDGDFEIIRIVRVYNQEKIKVKFENGISAGKEEKVLLKDLKGWTVLDSIGIVSFSVVAVKNAKGGFEKDVIVTLTRNIDVKTGIGAPCVICRQSITDFFYNILSTKEDHGWVGVSASDRTFPPNLGIEFGHLLACDDIEYSDMVNIYYNDTIDSVLECVNTVKFNDVLRNLYERHVTTTGNPALKFRKSDKGWCSNIKTLLELNNFWIDADQAFQINDVDFNIYNYIIEKKDGNNKEYLSLKPEVLRFFSETFKINIVDCILIEYWYDIDLAEYRNENYMLVRDNENLYLVVYMISGEYLEADLSIAKEQEHISNSLGLRIVNKYKE